MSDKKTASIGARINDSLRSRLDEIHRRFGPPDATMLEDALTALCDYVEHSNAYRRPMKMVFDDEADAAARQVAAESPPGRYGGSETVRRLTGKGREKLSEKDSAGKATRAART